MSVPNEAKTHTLNIENRTHAFISGVLNVESFDETNIVIETTMGELDLKGSDMHIEKFDTEAGELAVNGEFDSVEYSNQAALKGGFFSKLFG